MLIIGSQAAKHWNLLPEGVEPRDTDIICTFAEFQKECARIRAEEGIVRCVPLSDSKFHVRNKAGWNYEFEIAWPGSSAEALFDFCVYENGRTYAEPEVQYALKLSHRYLRNSPHFLKTMRDIQRLRQLGRVYPQDSWLMQEWLPKREAETYTYNHPKLDVTKDEFFEDSMNYVYDHDTIHLTQALLKKTVTIPCPDEIEGCCVLHQREVPTPAYTFYMENGAQVMTSKEKFFAQRWEIQLYGVYEESCVLALERSQIPNNFEGPSPRWSFEFALQKVCTSITSGWFREFAWENYDKVLDLYNELGEDDYIQRFKRNQHLLKPFKETSNGY